MTPIVSAEEDDRQVAVIAAVGYLFPPVVPAVVLLGGAGQQPALLRHARQALIWTIGFIVLLALAIVVTIWLARLDFLAICLAPFLLLVPFVPGAIWARRAYLGRPVRIRLLTPLAESWARKKAAG